MSRLIELVLFAYSMGLVVYSLLGWIGNPRMARVRSRLGMYYEPLLLKIRAIARPVPIGRSMVDVSSVILLCGLVVLKHVMLYLVPRGW